MIARRSWLLAVAALAGGCASLPPPAPPGSLLAGRLALQIAAHGGEPARQLSVGFELQGDAANGRLDLLNPVGLIAAQASWSPGRVELQRGAGEPELFASLDELAQQVLGEPLPLAALFDWLRGRPWAGAPSQAVAGGFEQLGWAVDTARLAEGQIVARRAAAPAITLRARLEAPA